MTLAEYQAWTVKNWSRGRKPSAMRSLATMSLGIAGEAGEVSDMVKKHIRTGKPMDTKALALELGDLLHYVVRTAAHFKIPAETLAPTNRAKIEGRNKRKRNRNWKVEKNT